MVLYLVDILFGGVLFGGVSFDGYMSIYFGDFKKITKYNTTPNKVHLKYCELLQVYVWKIIIFICHNRYMYEKYILITTLEM